MQEIKVVHVGLGPVGSRIVRHIVNERKGIRYVGAIDVQPEVVGQDLGKVAEVGKELGIPVSNDPRKLFAETRPDIAIYSTTSFVKDLFQQIEPAIESGVNVISTCEQLAFPDFRDKELTRKYDELAKKNNVTVLSTGINPGFLMDVLPAVLTAGCTEVKSIEVTRRMDASSRRKPFQKKIGTSMAPEEFRKAIAEGKITGHVGLEESICLIADALGWELDEITVESAEPVIAEKEVSSPFYTVKKGHVKGTKQEAYGIVKGERKICLFFTAFLGATPSFDAVRIEGTPRIEARVSPCWQGDDGTVAMVVNLIPTVINARPGVLTMNDIVPISFKSGDMSRFVRHG
ncbi:MAG: dihydrodipicolinate reductase [Dehalococcoidia bacterium]|nr:2,4-diaminopentanoate dehydrogenase [Chloroflexota bacterium]MBT9161762.1 2,4-diaminopentanoate dehydrogenase [Chloroflexota bacterium]